MAIRSLFRKQGQPAMDRTLLCSVREARGFCKLWTPRYSLGQASPQQWTEEELRQALARLSDDEREVVVLKFQEGYSTQAVADIMEQSPKAVRMLQHRALVRMREILHASSTYNISSGVP